MTWRVLSPTGARVRGVTQARFLNRCLWDVSLECFLASDRQRPLRRVMPMEGQELVDKLWVEVKAPVLRDERQRFVGRYGRSLVKASYTSHKANSLAAKGMPGPFSLSGYPPPSQRSW